nr:MAG TPA: hypothetical protein [Bacteriophage sp.]
MVIYILTNQCLLTKSFLLTNFFRKDILKYASSSSTTKRNT